ncbi:MAG TPA: ATP-binding protein, partial [Chthoniobacterales bacterium]|nr:ATP-binding protein [Chthoniobacterales bacterium]
AGLFVSGPLLSPMPNRVVLLPFPEAVKGQHHVKRALEVVAAGGHNILKLAPPNWHCNAL